MAEGWPTPSGAYMVDTMLANVCKQNVTRFHFEVARLAVDLAGGFIATLPSEIDLNSEEVGHLVRKNFHRRPDQNRPVDRGHDRRHGHVGIHAWSRFASGPKDHDLSGRRLAKENETGQKTGPNPDVENYPSCHPAKTESEARECLQSSGL